MNDVVNHPSHYTDGQIEVIDFIEDKNLNFHRGNAVKYISRAGKKDPNKEVEDLKKARWYLDREIKKMTGELPAENKAEPLVAGVSLQEALVEVIQELYAEEQKQRETEKNAKRRGDTNNEKIFGGVRLGLSMAIEKIERKFKL